MKKHDEAWRGFYYTALRICGGRYLTMLDDGAEYDNCMQFFQAAADKSQPLEELNRWLGYIQATVINTGKTTDSIERTWVRPLFRPLDFPGELSKQDRYEDFLALVEILLLNEYPWAQDQQKLQRFTQSLVTLICSKNLGRYEEPGNEDLPAVGEKESPLIYQAWRWVGMTVKLNDINMRKLNPNTDDQTCKN